MAQLFNRFLFILMVIGGMSSVYLFNAGFDSNELMRIGNVFPVLRVDSSQKDAEERISKLEHATHSLEGEVSRLMLFNNSSNFNTKLPSCQTMMQRPGSPYADGSILTRHTTPNAWTPRADGSREFDLTAVCTLKRYTGQEARQCLDGKHISFIGVSLTRYQYLSLAYFVEKGVYPPRFGRARQGTCKFRNERDEPACSNMDDPNVATEVDWVGWVEFHRGLGGAHDGGPFQGRMECNCARGGPVPGTGSIENILYVSPPSGSDKRVGTGKRVTLSYFSELGWGEAPTPVRGFNFTDCAYKGTCRMEKKHLELLERASKNDLDWSESLEDALKSNGILRRMFPDVDVSIFNRGLWGVLSKSRASIVMPRLYNWTGEKGRCFFKSTTGSGSSTTSLLEQERGAVRTETFLSGCSYLDIGHVTADFASVSHSHPQPPKQKGGKISNFEERNSLYWDYVHFSPWVYEELNNVLLNILCNSVEGS